MKVSQREESEETQQQQIEDEKLAGISGMDTQGSRFELAAQLKKIQ